MILCGHGSRRIAKSSVRCVRYAKYVGTMIGPVGYLHHWTAPRKFLCSVMKINASTKSLAERLCDFKISSDKATFEAENRALQCTTAGPYNAILSTLLGVGSVCGLGPDLVGIHSISLAARYRTAECSSTLNQGLKKIQAARGHKSTPIFAFSPIWEKEYLVPSMAYSTADAFGIVCRLDRNDTLDEVSHKTKGRKLQLACFWTKFINKTLLDLSLAVPRKPQDRSVVIVLLTSCAT